MSGVEAGVKAIDWGGGLALYGDMMEMFPMSNA